MTYHRSIFKILLIFCITGIPFFLVSCESKISVQTSKNLGAISITESIATGAGFKLTWSRVPKATSYTVIASQDSECASILSSREVTEPSTTFEASLGNRFFVCILPLDDSRNVIATAALRGFEVSYTPTPAAKFSKSDCEDPDLSKLQVGQRISLCDGSIGEGTAVVTDITNLIPANIKSGVTIAGVLGTDIGSSAPSCAASSQVNCLTNTSFPSTDSNTLTPYNQRSKGPTGLGKLKYCRAGYNLSVMDLPNAYANMHFYGRTFTVTAATDILSVRSKTFMQAFGPIPVKVSTSGTLPGGLSAGTTYYTIWMTDSTIKLATSFSNAIAGTGIDILDAGTGTHRVNTVGDGVAQYWDVTDDTNSSGSTRGGWNTSSIFGADYLCSASDWQILAPSNDGTSIVAGTSTDCDNAADDCMIQDKMTNQIWTEVNPKGGGASLTWAESIRFCDDLVFGGFTDWRLPILEEFLQANINGLYLFDQDYPASGTAKVMFRAATINSLSWNNSDNQSVWVHGNGGSQAENQHNTTQFGSAYALRCVRN